MKIQLKEHNQNSIKTKLCVACIAILLALAVVFGVMASTSTETTHATTGVSGVAVGATQDLGVLGTWWPSIEGSGFSIVGHEVRFHIPNAQLPASDNVNLLRLPGHRVNIWDFMAAIFGDEPFSSYLHVAESRPVSTQGVAQFSLRSTSRLAGHWTYVVLSSAMPFRVFPYFFHVTDNSIALPPDPTLYGHTFAGWYLDSAFTQRFTGHSIMQDTRLYARFTPISFTVTYITNGGVLPPDAILSFDVTTPMWVLPIPTRERHRFLGWFTNPHFTGESVPTFSAGHTGNRRFYARWEVMTFTVQFIVNGVVWREEVVEYGTIFSQIRSVHFQYWYLNDNLTQVFSENDFPITQNIILYGANLPPIPLWRIAIYAVGGIIAIVVLLNFLNMLIAGSKRSRRRRR